MATVALYHAGNNEAGHRQQSLDVSVNHRVPIFKISFILGFEAHSTAGIVHQHVNFLPLRGQTVDGCCSRLAVPHIKLQRHHPDSQGRQFAGDSIQAVGSAARNNHVVADLGQFARAGLSNAACRASN